jgi:hypothetical protein
VPGVILGSVPSSRQAREYLNIETREVRGASMIIIAFTTYHLLFFTFHTHSFIHHNHTQVQFLSPHFIGEERF